jgi:Domain of unknown function (DUF1929)
MRVVAVHATAGARLVAIAGDGGSAPVKVKTGLVTATLVGVALLASPGSAAGVPRETDAQRIARETMQAVRANELSALNTSLRPLTPAQRRQLAVSGEQVGRWTTCQLPAAFNPVHASVLPDGSVLLMAGSGNLAADFNAGRFQSYLFYPDTCSSYKLPTPGDMFCAGHANLPNGNVLLAGGTFKYDPFYGSRASYEYDWVKRQFVRVASMYHGRWYPSATEMGNGDVFVISGIDGVGDLNTQPEIYHWGTRTWSRVPYQFTVPTYPNILPTGGGRLFFTGVGFGGSAQRVGFLSPQTGAWQAVGGLDNNRRDQGASFFLPYSQGRKVMVAGGGSLATTALIDLYSSPNPTYRPGPTLSRARKYLSHATLFDGRVLLAGGQDPAGNPVYTTQLYQQSVNRFEPSAPTTAAHQYHSNMWVDPSGRAILVGGNPRRGVVQSIVEKFEPWYVDLPDRPEITSAPATIAHNQPFAVQVQLAAGATVKDVRLYRLTSTTHQFGAAEGDFTLAAATTPNGPGWSLTLSPSLTPPGYYYLVAVDSRGVPSAAKIVKVT